MKFLASLLVLSLSITAPPRRAEAAYKCRDSLPFQLCKFAQECEAKGHHVWERQFSDWVCYDDHGQQKRKACKDGSERAKATGVVDFHHFTDGTCYYVFGKSG